MLSGRTKLILSAAIFIIAIVVGLRAFTRQPVSLTMLGYTTNSFPVMVTWGIHYDGPRAYATIGVTNNTTQVFKYWLEVGDTNRSSNHCWSNAMHLVSVGTNNSVPRVWVSGDRIAEQWLLPHKGFAFDAIVPAEESWQVTFSYSSTNKPSRLWKKLPPWLVSRFISLSPMRTVSTEIIPAPPTGPPQGVAAGQRPPTRTGP
jgi:hypothetical protein